MERIFCSLSSIGQSRKFINHPEVHPISGVVPKNCARRRVVSAVTAVKDMGDPVGRHLALRGQLIGAHVKRSRVIVQNFPGTNRGAHVVSCMLYIDQAALSQHIFFCQEHSQAYLAS